MKIGKSLSVCAGSRGERLAKDSDSMTYRVRKGDSLSSSARRHGVNIKDVMRWNLDPDDRPPGEQLTLFVTDQSSPDS